MSDHNKAPDKHKEYIRKTLEFLHPEGVFELCALHPRKKDSALWAGRALNAVSGWYENQGKAARIARKLDQVEPAGIYVTLNPCKNDLLARADHRLKAGVGRTKDEEIEAIRNIMVDIDPVRPTDMSATPKERRAALNLAKKIREDLLGQGFPRPLLASSGNGAHLIFKASHENTKENQAVLQQFLITLAQKYDTDQAKIDLKTHNPARLVRLYGTKARKGEDSKATGRWHHYSKILSRPLKPKPLRISRIHKFIPEKPPENLNPMPGGTVSGGILDVPSYVEHYGRKVLAEEPHGSATLFVLKQCLFNPEHGRKEAAIGQCEDGTLFYQCFHNSCQPRTWREARQEISGDDSLAAFFTTKPKAEPNIRENFSIITGQDIRETAREDEPVIKGLLMEQENLEIVGPSGIGKSLITLNIALNLGMPSANKSLWGTFKIPGQCKTLFIQSENSLFGIKNRLGLIVKGNPDYEAALDKLIFPNINGDCRTSGNVTDPQFQHFLKEMIYATDSKVVVVDPLISFHHANENDNAEMRKYLDTLTSIGIETRTSLILIHHMGKSASSAIGGGRGASAIGDWADNVLSLEPGKDNTVKVSHQKSRHFSKHPDFCLERTGNLDFKRVTPDFDDESELVRTALEGLDGEAETQERLAEKMVEMGCSSISKAIRLVGKAEEAEVIEKVRQGKALVIKLKEE
jgi:hypothetical protein